MYLHKNDSNIISVGTKSLKVKLSMNKKQTQLLACNKLSSTEERQEGHTHLIPQKCVMAFPP